MFLSSSSVTSVSASTSASARALCKADIWSFFKLIIRLSVSNCSSTAARRSASIPIATAASPDAHRMTQRPEAPSNPGSSTRVGAVFTGASATASSESAEILREGLLSAENVGVSALTPGGILTVDFCKCCRHIGGTDIAGRRKVNNVTRLYPVDIAVDKSVRVKALYIKHLLVDRSTRRLGAIRYIPERIVPADHIAHARCRR